MRVALFSRVALMATVLLAATPARANDPVAERLYRDGRAAAQAKDWARACQLFQESQNREPAPGTLLNLADCEEHRGRLVTALAQYQVAARLFPSGDARIPYASQRAAALEKRIARLRLRLEAEQATVECDGVSVDTAAFDSYVAMDPGEHVLVVKANGRADMRSKIRLGEGESREVELTVGPLLPESSGAGPTRAEGPPAPAASTSPPRPAARDTSEPSGRPVAFGLLGVGLVGIGIGAVTGVLALDSAASVRDTCPNRQCGTATDLRNANDEASDARSMALVSTIGFGAGLVGAVAGTYLLLRAPSKPTLAPALGGGAMGVLVRGSF